MGIKQIIKLVQSFRQPKISPAEMDEIYKEASIFVEKIPRENFTQAVTDIFQAKNESSPLLGNLIKLKKYAEELDCPKEIKDAISKIEKETQEFVTKAETFSTKSRYPLVEENNWFSEKHHSIFDKIEEYFRRKMEATNYDEKYYNSWSLAASCRCQRPIEEFKISELPEGILPKNGVVYHGTTKGRKVTKEGLSPFRSRQISKFSREFGAGIYTTPDKSIASYFAKITGRIIPMKANVERTAFVEQYGFELMAYKSAELAQKTGINILEGSKLNNAIRELIISRLFREAGYDSVYTANGMSSGLLTQTIDDFIGKAQSQLVVFDPKKITLGKKKKLSQKINDELLQIKTAATSTVSTIKTVANDPMSFLMI